MYTGRETDTTGRKWVPAPTGTMPSGGTSAVMGVWLNDGERVDWHWCYTPHGHYACGYTIVTVGGKEEPCPMGVRVAFGPGEFKAGSGN